MAAVCDICELGPRCVSPFLSRSTLPGSVTPNFPIFPASPSSASSRPRWESLLGRAVPLALASVCRVRGGGAGGGWWLMRMETVFPSLERRPSVGAARIFPDTVYCTELWGVRPARAGFRWGFIGRFQACFFLRSRGRERMTSPQRETEGSGFRPNPQLRIQGTDC